MFAVPEVSKKQDHLRKQASFTSSTGKEFSFMSLQIYYWSKAFDKHSMEKSHGDWPILCITYAT